MAREYRMYIDGEWSDAADGGFYDDLNPFTGEVFARVASGKRADAARAVAAAAAAFPAWSRTLPSERRRLFLKAGDILEQKRDEVMAILAEETGCASGFATFQASFTPGLLREAASQVHQSAGEILPSDLPDAFNMTLRQPVGVVAGIGPWNAPLILSLRAICMPIAYGNTAVLKPSTESSVAGGVLIAEVFHQAGFPKGVLNVVTNGPGRSGEIGDEFIENPVVRRISMTGSSAVGRQLAEKAGRHLKRVALELGGQNPMIILADADIDHAVSAAVFGAFLHQGQICMSTRRILIERPAAARFTEQFVKRAAGLKVGDPRDPETVIGPIINRGQLEDIQKSVAADPVRRQGRGALLPSDRGRGSPARHPLQPRGDLRPGGIHHRGGRRRAGDRRGERDPLRALRLGDHARFQPRLVHRRADRIGDRAHQRPDRARRAADPLRGDQGQRLGPFRRPGGPGGIHRAALDQHAACPAPVSFLAGC